MKIKLLAGFVVLLIMVVTWLILEGILAVGNGERPVQSLAYNLYYNVIAGPARRQDAQRSLSPDLQVVTDAAQIEELLPDMKSSGVALGNSPYEELRTDDAQTETQVDGCRMQKPNLRKAMGFLRTTLFDRFDPINAFYTKGSPMSDRLRRFLDTYTFRTVSYTTEENGYRTTIPRVSSDRKVLIAGASIAVGLLLDDSETIASQMQSGDMSRQYINIGIGGGGHMSDIVCSLQRAEKQFPNQIDEVVFILGEIQQSATEPYGTAAELIPWLEEYSNRNGIKKLDFVYIPYIYNAMPDVTRRVGDRRNDFPYYASEKKSFLEESKGAGFKVVDFLDATTQIRRESGSQFSPFVYYVDVSHLSTIGTRKLIDMIKSD